MTHVTSFLSTKGGVSKTTTSVNYAWWLQNQEPDSRVILINTDRRPAAETWGEKRKKKTFPVIKKELALDPEDFALLIRGYDFVVIDGKPLLDEQMSATIALSNAIVVPLMPSDEDIRAAKETFDAIMLTPGAAQRSAAMLLVGQQTNTVLGRECYQGMQKLKRPHFTDTIERSVTWGESLSSGYSVFEIEPGGRAAKDAEKIFKQIRENM